MSRRFVVTAVAAGLIGAITPIAAEAAPLGSLTINDFTDTATDRSALLVVSFERDFGGNFGYRDLKHGRVEVKLTFASGDARTLTATGPAEDASLASTEGSDHSLAARDGRRLLIEASGFADPLKRIDVKTFAHPGDVVDHVIRKPVAVVACSELGDEFHDAFSAKRQARASTRFFQRRVRRLAHKVQDAQSAGDTTRAEALAAKLDAASRSFLIDRDLALLWGKRVGDVRFAENACP